MNKPEDIAAGLPCWSATPQPHRLEGGISNDNFLVEDQGRKFVVRVNGDVPAHGVLRSNDVTCNRAAAAVGVAPQVFYAEAGAVVVDFIEGRTYTEADVCDEANLGRILTLIKTTHQKAFRQIRGPVLAFWPFRVCRDYAFFLEDKNSKYRDELSHLRAANERLEAIVGKITPVLGHNDLLAANLVDDGKRIWLIDWEHAGFSSPLFDLANLAANNGLSEQQQVWTLETYFEMPLTEELQHQFAAMKCGSHLREAMWSMVSEITSSLDFDFDAYTKDYQTRFEAEYARL